jgi:hypothetical protein
MLLWRVMASGTGVAFDSITLTVGMILVSRTKSWDIHDPYVNTPSFSSIFT